MYELNDIFYNDKEYSQRAKWCNENGYVIKEIDADEEGKRRFQIQEITLSEEEIKQQRIYDIQYRLTELDQDIVQDLAGEIVPNIEERKAEFVELHNELRNLLGKESRALKN